MAVIARNFITIAEIYDGEDGASVFVADLDNEMTSVAVDADGKTTEAVTLTTRLSGYEGSDDVTSQMSVTPPATPPDGFTVTVGSDGLVTVAIASGTELADTTELAFSCSYDGAESGVTFTIAAAKPGADGKPATVYELRPSASQLSAQRNADGTFFPESVSLTCGYIKATGDGEPTIVESAAAAFDGHEVFFRMRGRDDAAWGGFSSYKDDVASAAGDLAKIYVDEYDSVEFVIGASGSTLDESTIIDRETVPITVDGADGAATTITGKWVKYAVTTEASRPADTSSEWSEDEPTDIDTGLWLWTWTHVEYSTGDETDAFSVSRTGIDGKGIKSSVITYSLQAGSTDPESITDWGGFPSELTDGYWLYTRTVITYSDGNTTTSYSVSQVGTGSYYAGCEERYSAGDSADTPPSGYAAAGTYAGGETVSTTWTQERPTLTSAKPYLWNFEISSDSAGNRYVTSPVCIGNFAKGIVSIVETYAISAYNTHEDAYDYPTDIAAADWTDEQADATPTDGKPYQWNKTETTYNDGTADCFYHVSAVKAADGRGIASITEWYLRSKSASDYTQTDGDWKTTPPTLTATYRYLWNKERINYTDGTSAYSTPHVAGMFSEDGDGVASVVDYYLATDQDSGVTTATSGWTTTVQSVNAVDRYLWNYEVTTYAKGGTLTVEPHIVGAYGEAGLSAAVLTLSRHLVQVPCASSGVPADAFDASITARLYVDDMEGSVTSATLLNDDGAGQSWSGFITATVGDDGTATVDFSYDNAEDTSYPQYVQDDVLGHSFTLRVEGTVDEVEYIAFATFAVEANKSGAKGDTGGQGDAGADAVEMAFSPDTVAFTTDEYGSLSQSSMSATLKALKAGTEYTATVKSVDVVSGCTAGGKGSSTLTISPTVSTELDCDYYDADGELANKTLYVPPSAGYAIVTGTVTIGGTAYTRQATLRFTVDYSSLYDTFSTDNGQFLSKFGELSADTRRNWKEVYTELRQTRGSIGMHVYNQYAEASATDGKNLVPHSYVRYYGSSATPKRSFELVAGTEYTLSARGLVNSTLLTEATVNRMAVIAYADGWAESHKLTFTSTELATKSACFTAGVGGAWHVYACAVDSSGAQSSEPSLDDSRFYVEYIQVEEGDTHTDWQACATDDAANAPLCKDWTAAGKARAERPDGTQGYVAYYDNTDGSVEVELLSKEEEAAIVAGTTYTLSFYAKGSGEIFATLSDTGDDSPCSGSVADGAAFTTDGDGMACVTLSDEWVFHEVTFTAAASVADGSVIACLTLYAGSAAWVADWKLEEGGKATRGLADNLLPTGLDMYDDLFVITSDNVVVRNNSGETTAMLDDEGNLTAGSLNTSGDTSDGTDYSATISIKDGLITVNGEGGSKMVFGLDSKGYPHLSFYGYGGEFYYDLGPDSIGNLTNKSWLETLEVISITGTLGYSGLTDGAYCTSTKWADVFNVVAEFTTTKLYVYHAAKVNGVSQADDDYGLATGDEAAEADGKAFTAFEKGSGSKTYATAGDYYMFPNTGENAPKLVNTNGSVYNYRKAVLYIGVDGEMTAQKLYCTQSEYRKINGTEEGGD